MIQASEQDEVRILKWLQSTDSKFFICLSLCMANYDSTGFVYLDINMLSCLCDYIILETITYISPIELAYISD